MNYNFNKGLVLVLAFSLVASVFVAGLAQDKPKIKNPNTLTIATSGTANTLDPAYAYDTASSNIITNVYEGLLKYPTGKVDANEKKVEGYSVSKLKPLLATKVPSKENGLIREMPGGGLIYEFPIREGVTFHNGNKLTPEDVEYSFERAMIQDRSGGPAWMILDPLTGYASVEKLVADVAGKKSFKETTKEDRMAAFNSYIDPAVEVKGQSVVFRLPKPYPPFLNIVANVASWSSIVDKQWVSSSSVGGWPGTAESWPKYHNPGGGQAAEESPLYDKMNGTGPFKLKRWEPGTEAVFTRYEDYWRKPADLQKVVFQKVKEWSTRRLKLRNGQVDIAYTPLQFLGQVEGAKGITVQKHLPTIQMNPVAFFTQDVKTKNNDLVGSGSWGDGIPSNFFNDIKVRKAFNYAFQYEAFINQVLQGMGYKTNGPVPKNMEPFYNDNIKPYSYNLDKAKELLKEAHDGELWEKGFTFTILYNTGNTSRKTAASIFEANIEKLNDKFNIKVRGVDWSTYLDKMIGQKMPIFIIGWIADFPDPHNFVKPFMASNGTFSGWQGKGMVEMAKNKFDPLIDKAMATTDTQKRKEIYYELQKMAHDLAIDVFLPQAEGTRVMRSWVQDVPFNPMYSEEWTYVYPIDKYYE
ncbi:MAG: ABC transporter substrate-binding protein [Candidatus Bipolaricaulia bacterium]